MIGKIDFFICGTQKGGTSALDNYLRLHPEICMADQKELHFFDDESNFLTPNINYDKLHCHFSPGKSSKLFGEATPIYMYWENVPKRLWEYNPNALLIILLRNPIERAFSHWQMEFNRKNEKHLFLHSIALELLKRQYNVQNQHRIFSYIDRGLYLQQLNRIWEFFPKNQTLLIKSEHLKSNPNGTLSRVFDFLNIEPISIKTPLSVNYNNYTHNLRLIEKLFLNMIFKKEINKIELQLSWDCSTWKQS